MNLSAIALSLSSEKNLSTEDFKVPSVLYLMYTNPAPPTCGRFTNSVSSSNCFLVYSAHPLAQIPTTSSELSNTEKPFPFATSLSSTNFISKRVSGLSEP